MQVEKLWHNVFFVNGRIATKNLVRGYTVYGEKLVYIEEGEVRFWNPFRSKLAAAIKRDLQTFPFKDGTSVLYLGIATGTTASHISDVVGMNGIIYGVDFAPVSVRDLVAVCEVKQNIIPLLADANNPSEYKDVGKVDVIFQDISQPNQFEILQKNVEKFLKDDGFFMIAVKSQCIDVTKSIKQLYDEFLDNVRDNYVVVECFTLDPYEKDHLFVVGRKKAD